MTLWVFSNQKESRWFFSLYEDCVLPQVNIKLLLPLGTTLPLEQPRDEQKY